ncbi:hypothetical protein ALC62_02392 [Cyphomyrmex costatus]|uniref:Uncharacterized protein n=1 Tax=Cyphomyrmex costatus TaxID=456900 RepID=A0A195D1F1_9HYME|nr:hypothetical protein ALC62_02392 [Cyphomyrmex costatus]
MLYLYVYIYMQASNPSPLKFPKETRSFSSGNSRTINIIFDTISHVFSARCTARSCYKCQRLSKVQR